MPKLLEITPEQFTNLRSVGAPVGYRWVGSRKLASEPALFSDWDHLVERVADHKILDSHYGCWQYFTLVDSEE